MAMHVSGVNVSCVCVQIATFLATFLPLWESRAVLIAVLSALVTCKRADPKVETCHALDTSSMTAAGSHGCKQMVLVLYALLLAHIPTHAFCAFCCSSETPAEVCCRLLCG